MATLVYNDQQMKETEDKNALFPFLLPPCLSPLYLDLFKLRPPRVGEKEDDDQPKNQSSNSHSLGQTSSVDPLAKTDDQDTSAKWECRQSPILMPPRVAKILNQENHVSTTQWLPEDVWKDLNFMVGLSLSLYLKVMRCVCGLEKWYHILKPERSNQALFKSLYQGAKEPLRQMGQRSREKNG